MSARSLTKAFVVPAAAVLLVLLILAALLYRWSNQISEATTVRLADSLQMSMTNWRLNLYRDVSDVERYLATMEPLVAQDRRQALALAERADPERLIGTFEARFEAHRLRSFGLDARAA